MSFSRAKLQRFNDIKAGTPSTVKDILKSVAPNQKDKFVISKSPSLNSIQSTPCFRTPILPIKKKLPTSTTKSKGIALFKKEIDKDALKEKIVECKNKDEYINDLMEQIEDMKMQLSQVQEQKCLLEIEKFKFDQQIVILKEEHQNNIFYIKEKHDANINEIKLKMNSISVELNQNKVSLKSLKLDYSEELKELHNNITTINEKQFQAMNVYKNEIEIKDMKIQELEEEQQKLKQSYESIIEHHNEKILNLNEKHQQEIQDLEYEMLKTISQLQKLLDKEKVKNDKITIQLKEENHNEIKKIQELHKNDKKKMKEDYEAKIIQIEENCSELKILTEIQFTEKCKDIEESWKIKLKEQEKQADAILKECQAISEYNIIQCELEKKKIKQELTDKINELQKINEIQVINQHGCNSCNILNDKYNNLEIELNNVICKLSTDHKLLQEELQRYKSKLELAVGERKIYEYTINKTHDTIDALKSRLLESDRDVEQLKKELEQCEVEKLMYEGKSNQLLEELHVVLKLYEDLDIQQELYTIQNKDHIADVEKYLHNKVDKYKNITNESINYFQKELKMKEFELNNVITDKLKVEEMVKDLQIKLQQRENDLYETMEQLHEQQKLTSDVQLSVGDAVLEIDNLEYDYNSKIIKLQNLIKKKDEEVNSLKSSMKILENKSNNKEELEDLIKQVNQLRDKSNSYFQYCEYYKNKAMEYEEEIEDLSKINKKYISQSGKYDALLQKCEKLEKRSVELELKVKEQEMLLKSMQNRGEVFDKILDYKEKNSQLIDDKMKMETKIASQNKLIEKLKKEVALMNQSPKKMKSKAEKENINSPNRLLNSSHVSSPLKERN